MPVTSRRTEGLTVLCLVSYLSLSLPLNISPARFVFVLSYLLEDLN